MYACCVVVEALTPLAINVSLKSSLILLDSIPFPKEKQLYHHNPDVITSAIFSLKLKVVLKPTKLPS